MSPVVTVDCDYLDPHRAAVFLLIEGNRAAFLDNNTVFALPRLLEALDKHGIARENVDYNIVTHAHLDHAGGTGALLEACPNAIVLAHPKAARHLIQPDRLIEGVKAVYGEESFHKLYGEIGPIESSRVRSVEDGEALTWGNRTLRFLHMLGHATHHICLHDSVTNAIFTGDTFGLARTELSRPGPPVHVCSTAPTDFDAEEARKTVRRLADMGAERAYVTHYGHFDDLSAAAEQLLDSIDWSEAIQEEAYASDLSGEPLMAYCEDRIWKAILQHFEKWGEAPGGADRVWFTEDIRLSAMGLAYVVERQRRKL